MTTHALKLASPGELIAAVPFLLGFHPSRSVVLMALQQRRLNLTQRLDLPDPGAELQAATVMIRPLLRDQPDSALIVGFEDVHARPLSRRGERGLGRDRLVWSDSAGRCKAATPGGGSNTERMQ